MVDFYDRSETREHEEEEISKRNESGGIEMGAIERWWSIS